MSESTEYKAEYEYTPSFARKAFLVTLWRRCKVLIIMSLLAVAHGIFGVLSTDGIPSLSLLYGLEFGMVVVLWSSWIGGFRLSGRFAASLRDRTIHIILTDEACKIQSSFITSSVRWEGIKTVYQSRDMLIVHYRDTPAYSRVSASALSEDAREFFMRKVREAGGRVC